MLTDTYQPVVQRGRLTCQITDSRVLLPFELFKIVDLLDFSQELLQEIL